MWFWTFLFPFRNFGVLPLISNLKSVMWNYRPNQAFQKECATKEIDAIIRRFHYSDHCREKQKSFNCNFGQYATIGITASRITISVYFLYENISSTSLFTFINKNTVWIYQHAEKKAKAVFVTFSLSVSMRFSWNKEYMYDGETWALLESGIPLFSELGLLTFLCNSASNFGVEVFEYTLWLDCHSL